MSERRGTVTEWDFLIGYPLDEALQILQEEGISYELQFTVAPGKVSSEEDAFVIAVRNRDSQPMSLAQNVEAEYIVVCASTDWDVS